jgi:hypothetical protein
MCFIIVSMTAGSVLQLSPPSTTTTGAAQFHALPVGLGVRFNLPGESRGFGEDTGINDTQHFLMLPSAIQENRGQQRLRSPEDIAGEIDREGIY